jgi:predicted O-linked N-acetylglucosamine transferase (SPINDLY family)
MGKHEVAVGYIRRAIQLTGTEAAFHVNLGNALNSQGKLDESIVCFRRALGLKPDFVEAHNNLGTALQDQGRLDEASACYRRAIELDPRYAEAYNNLGNVLKDQGKLDEAADSCRRALQLKPDFAQAHYNLGLALQKQGRLDEAVACYRRALDLRPQHAEARFDLGNALQQQGNLDEAVACYRRVLELKPDFAPTHNNLGTVFKKRGKLDEAIACYRRALELWPGCVEAHNNLGLAFQDREKFDDAVACYHQALQRAPHFVEAHYNLGNALQQQGKLDDAIACYRRALQLKPDYAGVHNNLGTAFKEQRKLDEAIACYRRAVELKPDFAEAHHNLGIAFKEQGKLDNAAACVRQAMQLKPDYALPRNTLGAFFKDQGKLDEAIACYRRALELKPDFAEAYNNLGAAFKDQGKLDDAIACFRRALDLKPDYHDTQNNLGTALEGQGKLDEAVACYRRALELKPDNRAVLAALIHQLQHACRWSDLKDLCPRLIGSLERQREPGPAFAPSPFSFLTMPIPTSSRQQLLCARDWAGQQWKTESVMGCPRVLGRPPVAKSKLTVGYLSADFQAHATAYLIAELFEKHDHTRFSVFGYSFGPDDGSAMRRRLVNAFDRFVDVKDASFLDAAERIAADEVDILVDLKGYTTDSRTQILAFRPAPIQVNYLGYPGTMGASFMDYILVDDFVVPADQQPFFSEKLVHLPGCYQVNDSQREISSHTPSRAECGLPEEGFVFCCFNNSYKITPEMFTVWMELLKAVPRSVLGLLEGNRFSPANLRREAEARQVAAQRLVFAPRCPMPEHLARYRSADLFLDAFPVNAHTTASDALWAGCPVLTMAGETFVSRVAGSLLRTIGLPELVTTSLDEYHAMALRLARDESLLASLRARLEINHKTSRLFDAGRFAKGIEKAYLTMWEIHACGQPPRAFTVSET